MRIDMNLLIRYLWLSAAFDTVYSVYHSFIILPGEFVVDALMVLHSSEEAIEFKLCFISQCKGNGLNNSFEIKWAFTI